MPLFYGYQSVEKTTMLNGLLKKMACFVGNPQQIIRHQSKDDNQKSMEHEIGYRTGRIVPKITLESGENSSDGEQQSD